MAEAHGLSDRYLRRMQALVAARLRGMREV
jgi:hypothetical protein